MAFRELSMIDVREVLRRWQAGQSARQIANAGVADRKTVGRYVDVARAEGVTRSTELTDEIVATVARIVQERPATAESDEWKKVDEHRTRIEGWLKGENPLRLVRVHELLVREGVEVSYTTLWRFAHREIGWRERPSTVRVDDPPPGEEAQVDFGRAGYVMTEEGKRRALWMLIVTLTMSRYMFVWPTFLQTVVALCDGLDAAWSFFGGVVHRIVPDNTAAAVITAHPMSPVLNKSFAEYAQLRGFFVDPARARHPKDKPRVENQVPYVRERWFAGEQFTDELSELRAHAENWCREIAGARVHGTTRRVPREVYETEERKHMLPMPTSSFDVPTWARAKVHPDHHVQVGRALYSAPTRYIGKELEVRSDRISVRLYSGTELIKVHPRVEPGKRKTDPNDYPVGKADYAFRNVDGLIERAREKGEHVGRYAECLLGGPLPWTKMRQAYALLRLCDRYGADRVNDHCARALAFDVIDVPRIERMLKAARRAEESASSEGKVMRLPTARFARDASSFATINSDDDSEKGGAS